jgi:hypothetical protein
MNINRKQIMETFIRTIDHVSDAEYQKRIWIEGRGPECDNFDEFVTYFFDESTAILESYKDFGITEEQYQLLKKFQENLEVFCDENDYPEKFIDTSEWTKITEMAKEVLKAFNYQRVK